MLDFYAWVLDQSLERFGLTQGQVIELKDICEDYSSVKGYVPAEVMVSYKILKSEYTHYQDKYEANVDLLVDETARVSKTLLETSIKLLNAKFGDNYARTNPNVLSNVLNTHRSVYLSLQTK